MRQLPPLSHPLLKYPKSYNSFPEYKLLTNDTADKSFWVYWDQDSYNQNVMHLRAIAPATISLSETSNIVSLQSGFTASSETKIDINNQNPTYGIFLNALTNDISFAVYIIGTEPKLIISYLRPDTKSWQILASSKLNQVPQNSFNRLTVEAKNNEITATFNGTIVTTLVSSEIVDSAYQLRFIYFGNANTPVPQDFYYRNLTVSPLTSTSCDQGDINHDGQVNILDFAIWKFNYFKNKVLK